MNLVQIKHPYQHIFSLGGNCGVAYQLRRTGLRKIAGPIDWMVTPNLRVTSQLIRDRFHGFMELSNMTMIGTTDNSYIVHDNHSHCTSVHDFHIAPNLDWTNQYPAFQNQLNRRIVHFLHTMQTTGSILFIRATQQGVHDQPTTVEEAQELVQALSGIMKGYFNLLIVNSNNEDQGITEEEHGIDRVCFLRIPHSPNATGDDTIWNYILHGISNA